MKKEIFNIGDKVWLHGGTQQREFIIIDSGYNEHGLWYRQGGSSICFDAKYIDKVGFNHYGKLKKFFLSDKTKDFEEEANEYISSYRNLHKIVSINRSLSSIYSFVPEFEVYFDEDACPYIWTNNIPMKTFEEIYRDIIISDTCIGDSLFEIVTTLKSLTDCIRILHNNNLIHGDINPSNFGFYLRNGKVLAEGVSLFDLNTLRYTWQEPKWFNPPYYKVASSPLEYGNRADIRAIGVTLCKALGLDDAEINNIEEARKFPPLGTYNDVGKIVMESDLFKFKEPINDKRVADQLVKVIAETLTNTYSRKLSSCTKLIQELQRLETYLLPHCTKDEIDKGYGIEIVNREEERQDRVHELFQYLLYRYPLYRYQSDNESENYNVLLIGFGLDAQKFLDVCLETAQSMDQKIEVDVYGADKLETEKQYYLGKRPAINQFFLIDDQREKLTGEAYGHIKFNTLKGNNKEVQLERIISENRNISYIYIASGSDKENSNIAEFLAEKLKTEHVFICAQCEQETRDKNGIHYLCMKDCIRRDYVDYKEIERMSFNTHLIWSGTLNTNLERKKEEYLSNYYHSSCISNVLSIKYKLHYLGIEISEDVYAAAKAFKNSSNSTKAKMVVAEHRRWVTEKICDGWINMKVEDSLQYNDTKDIDGKRHICILRSGENYGISGELANHGNWNNVSKKQLSKLDELDSMSIRLHQAYIDYEKKLNLDYIIKEETVNAILDELNDIESVQRCFIEWNECIRYFFDEFVKNENKNTKYEVNILEYEALYYKLIDELESTDLDILKKKSLKSKFISINNAFLPVSRCLKYHDYKKNDKDLIDNMPFILTYTEDITMVVPMDYDVLVSERDDVKPTEMFSYIAAATVVNPKDLYFPYMVLAEENEYISSLILQKKKNMEEYINRKGLRTKIHFIKIYDRENLSQILKPDKGGKIDGWLLVENSKIDIINTDGIDKISNHFGLYTFDMKNIKFTDTDAIDWLNNINRKVSITVRDIAGFFGRDADIKEQPSFRKEDNKLLFSIYKSNRKAWREICALLKSSANRNNKIIRFKEGRTAKVEKHIFFMPYTCFKAADVIIRKLKDKGLIKSDSCIDRYSIDACKIIINESSGCGDELQKLFANQHLLTATHKFSLVKINDTFELICEGLKVEEIKFDFNKDHSSEKMLSLLKNLQSNGFIQTKIKKQSFDITYGSWQIKNIFMNEGNLLEIYTYYKARELNTFDDVVTGVIFSNENGIENEIDCLATKGFQTVIVECKARGMRRGENSKAELLSFKKELQRKVKKYGINGCGLLVLDSENGIPEVEDIEGVEVCYKSWDILDIGKAISRQITNNNTKEIEGDYNENI
jgi:domain of unknown function (DUF1887)